MTQTQKKPRLRIDVDARTATCSECNTAHDLAVVSEYSVFTCTKCGQRYSTIYPEWPGWGKK